MGHILVLFLNSLGQVLDPELFADQILVFSNSQLKFLFRFRIFFPLITISHCFFANLRRSSYLKDRTDCFAGAGAGASGSVSDTPDSFISSAMMICWDDEDGWNRWKGRDRQGL